MGRESYPPSFSEVNIGQRLRTLREERNLSLRALAEKSGLATNTLGLIEHGKTSPSVSTLQQIAAALAVPITRFFETERPDQQIVLTRSGQASCGEFDNGTLADLGAGLQERTVEPFLVTIAPGATSGAEPITHMGQEFIFCIEGSITYDILGQTYVLNAGDSLLFFAHLPHLWRNESGEATRVLMIFCPFGIRDRPNEFHFSQVRLSS